jgi:hypothetical protein
VLLALDDKLQTKKNQQRKREYRAKQTPFSHLLPAVDELASTFLGEVFFAEELLATG